MGGREIYYFQGCKQAQTRHNQKLPKPRRTTPPVVTQEDKRPPQYPRQDELPHQCPTLATQSWQPHHPPRITSVHSQKVTSLLKSVRPNTGLRCLSKWRISSANWSLPFLVICAVFDKKFRVSQNECSVNPAFCVWDLASCVHSLVLRAIFVRL